MEIAFLNTRSRVVPWRCYVEELGKINGVDTTLLPAQSFMNARYRDLARGW